LNRIILTVTVIVIIVVATADAISLAQHSQRLYSVSLVQHLLQPLAVE
jgi:hypothetical protein